MKFRFEGEATDWFSFVSALHPDPGPNPDEPEISQALIDRENLITEAIHLVNHARQVQVDRENLLNHLRGLIRERNTERDLRVQWETLAREAMTFVDRQLGGVTTEMSLYYRLKELEQYIASTPTRTLLHRGVSSEVLQPLHHKDESQTPSEGDGNPASESQNVTDHF